MFFVVVSSLPEGSVKDIQRPQYIDIVVMLCSTVHLLERRCPQRSGRSSHTPSAFASYASGFVVIGKYFISAHKGARSR